MDSESQDDEEEKEMRGRSRKKAPKKATTTVTAKPKSRKPPAKSQPRKKKTVSRPPKKTKKTTKASSPPKSDPEEAHESPVARKFRSGSPSDKKNKYPLPPDFDPYRDSIKTRKQYRESMSPSPKNTRDVKKDEKRVSKFQEVEEKVVE